MWNVKDFGAKGDGITLDSPAIQAAIDAGGMVYIPDGTYLVGTLYLKSNGGLHLAPGAVLKASHNRNDYNSVDFCPQNQVFPSEFMAGTHMITAVEQENISITGFGTIDGDCHHWVNETCRESYCEFWGHPPADANRPAQMIFLAECRGIHIQNLHLKHSPFWHLFLHGCQDAQIQGIRVTGERRTWVNDGIDLDCCSRVTISDCIIDTGDDAITLRANGFPLTKKEAVCEQITVTNCILTSYLDYGIRIGVGQGLIRDCIFSNLVIRNSLSGIGVTCRFSPKSHGTTVENIRFDHMIIEALDALDLRISIADDHPPLPEPAWIRDLTFSNLSIRTKRTSRILDFDNGIIENIRFSNVDFRFTPEDPTDHRYPCYYRGSRDDNTAFLIRGAEQVTFSDCGFQGTTLCGWESDILVLGGNGCHTRDCHTEKGVLQR